MAPTIQMELDCVLTLVRRCGLQHIPDNACTDDHQRGGEMDGNLIGK